MESSGALETREGTVYGVMGAFFPVAVAAVSLRLYSRIRFSYVGADDVLIVLALILLVAWVATNALAIRHGMARHIWTVSPENGITMEKCGFASQIMYPPSMGLVKVSILLFLVRVLPTVHTAKLRLWCFAALIAITEVAFTFAIIFQCSPVHSYWYRAMPGRKCFNQPLFYYIDASVNILYDLGVLITPTLLFRNLKVPRKQKYGVIALCSAGVFTLASSVLRLPYLHNLNQSEDPTWDVVNVVIWSCAEHCSAIIFSCVPTMKPIYIRIRDRYRQHKSDSKSGTSSTTPQSSNHAPYSPSALGNTNNKQLSRYLQVEDQSLENLAPLRAVRS